MHHGERISALPLASPSSAPSSRHIWEDGDGIMETPRSPPSPPTGWSHVPSTVSEKARAGAPTQSSLPGVRPRSSLCPYISTAPPRPMRQGSLLTARMWTMCESSVMMGAYSVSLSDLTSPVIGAGFAHARHVIGYMPGATCTWPCVGEHTMCYCLLMSRQLSPRVGLPV